MKHPKENEGFTDKLYRYCNEMVFILELGFK